MQKNADSVVTLQPLSKDETILIQFNLIKEENEKLQLENEALKKNLEKEKFYHQNLYQQWNQLNSNITDKDRELEHFRSTQNPKLKGYQYAFYGLFLITLLLIIFLFYLVAIKIKRQAPPKLLGHRKRQFLREEIPKQRSKALQIQLVKLQQNI